MLPAGISSEGSPPRGRGKVNGLPFAMSGVGITPAWAGKSQTLHFNSHRTGDHPRVGGEKYAGRRHRGDLKGSPPRGRGKGQLHPWAAFHAGITPAWAGKRHTLKTSSRDDWDHPRVGGEKFTRVEDSSSCAGSPPRGRGKGGLALCWPPPPRITPAWAGKSTWAPSFKDLLQDHPRVGGEKQKTGFSGLCYVGSPPRGRGKAGVDLS